MTIFGTSDDVIPEVSDDQLAAALSGVKRAHRQRRLFLLAPGLLAAAVVTSIAAGPSDPGELELIPDAEAAADPLPWVFGQNGVWSFAEPIVASTGAQSANQPPRVSAPEIQVPLPEYALAPPSAAVELPTSEAGSLPVPLSTPPTSAPGQTLPATGPQIPEPDWREAQVPTRLLGGLDDPAAALAPPDAEDTTSATVDGVEASFSEAAAPDGPSFGEAAGGEPDGTRWPLVGDAEDLESQVQAPWLDPSAETAATTAVVGVNPVTDDAPTQAEQAAPTGDAVDETAADAGSESGANPSTPPVDGTDDGIIDAEVEPASTTVSVTSVLVQSSAHVSVTVHVVDDELRFIDWCNTLVDWGDGLVTRAPDVDGQAVCAASCEQEARPSTSGTLDQVIVFEHTYTVAIDAAPVITVSTGDGCTSAPHVVALNAFTVVPR